MCETSGGQTQGWADARARFEMAKSSSREQFEVRTYTANIVLRGYYIVNASRDVQFGGGAFRARGVEAGQRPGLIHN